MLGLSLFSINLALIRVRRRRIQLAREITLAESNPRIRIGRYFYPNRMHARRRLAIRFRVRLKAQQIVVVNVNGKLIKPFVEAFRRLYVDLLPPPTPTPLTPP